MNKFQNLPKVILFAITVTLFSIITTSKVQAATRTWDGEGGNNDWSTCANWSSNTCPTSADQVNFDSTSVKDSVIDAGFGGVVNYITVFNTYSGTITQARSLHVLNDFTLNGGSYSAGSHVLDVDGGIGANNAPSFTVSSTNTYAGYYFYVNSNFHANGGTITFDSTSFFQVVNCAAGNAVFNSIVINSQQGIEVNSCQLPLGNNPTIDYSVYLSGTGSQLYGTGTATFNQGLNAWGTSSVTGFTDLIADRLTVDIVGNLDLSDVDNVDVYIDLTVYSGTTLTAPNSMLKIGYNLVVDPSAVLNYNNTTLELYDYYGPSSEGNISCGDFNLTNTVNTNFPGNKLIQVNCNLELGNDPVAGRIDLYGSINGTGTLTIPQLVVESTNHITGFDGILSDTSVSVWGPIDLSDYTSASFTNLQIQNGGTFTAPSLTMSIENDGYIAIYSGGVFNHSNGTVDIINGTSFYMTGDWDFYNLNYLADPNSQLMLGGDATFTFEGDLTLKGTSGNLLQLYNDWDPAHPAIIDPQGDTDFDYLDIKNIKNIGTHYIQLHGRSTDSGGNVKFNFNDPEVDTLAPNSVVNGSTLVTNQPTFTFNLTDDDSSDTVKFKIEIDDNSNFSSPVINYTSAFGAQGAKSFTVGQAAGSGSYTTGTSGQTLGEGNFYWRVTPYDNAEGIGTRLTANAGLKAFTIGDGIAADLVGSIEINNGDATTTTKNVDLGITYGTGVTYMMISEDNTFSGASWVAADTTSPFTLTSGDGLKTVYIKFKDDFDNESPTYSDTITLELAIPTGSITINNGALTTTSRDVTLGLTKSSDVTEMLISEDSSFTGASWESFLSSKAFTLSENSGNKTVYAMFRNADLTESIVYSYTINYQPVAQQEQTNPNPVTDITVAKIINVSDTLPASYPAAPTASPSTVTTTQDDEVGLKIKVTDENGNPVVGAKVRIEELGLEAITNAEGIAIFRGIDEGVYDVRIEYNAQVLNSRVSLSSTNTVKVELPANNTMGYNGIFIVCLICPVLLIVLFLVFYKKKKDDDNKFEKSFE
jgi:hypothetical protein